MIWQRVTFNHIFNKYVSIKMRNKLCETFYPWCRCIKTRCLLNLYDLGRRACHPEYRPVRQAPCSQRHKIHSFLMSVPLPGLHGSHDTTTPWVNWLIRADDLPGRFCQLLQAAYWSRWCHFYFIRPNSLQWPQTFAKSPLKSLWVGPKTRPLLSLSNPLYYWEFVVWP